MIIFFDLHAIRYYVHAVRSIYNMLVPYLVSDYQSAFCSAIEEKTKKIPNGRKLSLVCFLPIVYDAVLHIPMDGIFLS